MLHFRASMHYRVTADGKAYVTERRTVRNETGSVVSFEPYQEGLPDSVDLSSFRVYVERSAENRQPIEYEIVTRPGTNRQAFLVPAKPVTSIDFETGETSLVTEFTIDRFFHIRNKHGCFVFYFHHSLPEHMALVGNITKTITIEIEKPSNVLSSWRALFIDPPRNDDYERFLTSFSKYMHFHFQFTIGPNQHYFNTIVLRKVPRFNHLAEAYRAIFSLGKNEIAPS